MKKLIIFLSLSASFTLATTAANKPVYNHVPEKLGPDVRKILPASKDKNHILIVNVNNAMPAETFGTVVTYALSRINVNAWTNTLDKSIVMDLIQRPACLKEKLGSHATVAVFIEKNAEGPSFLNAPGHWAMVNMRGLDRDNPDPQKLRDRYAKMVLKGIGHACGAGASVEDLCALNYDSYTLEGMDKTDIRLSAMAYFPMLSTLRALGGNEVTSPVYE